MMELMKLTDEDVAAVLPACESILRKQLDVIRDTLAIMRRHVQGHGKATILEFKDEIFRCSLVERYLVAALQCLPSDPLERLAHIREHHSYATDLEDNDVQTISYPDVERIIRKLIGEAPEA